MDKTELGHLLLDGSAEIDALRRLRRALARVAIPMSEPCKHEHTELLLRGLRSHSGKMARVRRHRAGHTSAMTRPTFLPRRPRGTRWMAFALPDGHPLANEARTVLTALEAAGQ